MKMPDLTLPYITERDVDLLLVEELKCSPKFREWFLGMLVAGKGIAGLGSTADFRVRHSVSDIDGSGETDIQFDFTAVGQGQSTKWRAFIEDKIDAPFQEQQPQRYRRRAESYKKGSSLNQALTVLVAPDEYLSGTPGSREFDVRISYEQLKRDYFDSRTTEPGEAGQRFAHKAEILAQAVEFHDYFPVPDDANTRFWAEYYQLAQEIAPALQMEKPRPRPAGSYCVTCTMELVRKHGLPRCEVVHWLPLGKVKLWVAGLGECIDAVAPVVEPLLGADMYLQRAGKSLAVTVDVPELNVQQPFASQRGAAEKGLVAALRLQKWQHENAAALQQIATAIGEKRP